MIFEEAVAQIESNHDFDNDKVIGYVVDEKTKQCVKYVTLKFASGKFYFGCAGGSSPRRQAAQTGYSRCT